MMISDQPPSQARQLYDAFLNKRENSRNTAAQTAQQLVNLFRHLPHFGDDFIQEFNKRVLSMPADVQMALSDLVSGPSVRQYAEYLRMHQINAPSLSSNTSESFSETVTEGWLPDPENDLTPTKSIQSSNKSAPTSGTAGTLGAGGTQRLKKFMQTLINMQHNESMKQAAFLQTALQQLQDGLSRQISEALTSPHQPASSKHNRKLGNTYPRGSFCKRGDHEQKTWVPTQGDIEIVSDDTQDHTE